MVRLSYILLVIIVLSKCGCQDTTVDCSDSSDDSSDESDEKRTNCNNKDFNTAKEEIDVDQTIDNEEICNSSDIAYSCSGSVSEFECRSEGRFPDLSDPTCRRYFQCDKLKDGTFSIRTLRCPNSAFCPFIQKCSSIFICPCNSTNTEPTTSKSTSIISSTYSKPSESDKKAEKSISTSEKFTTTSYKCSGVYPETDTFNCTAWGRFPDLTDPSCQNYFLCSVLQNGSFVQTGYKCLNSVFDPKTKRCSKQYICPCSITSSTSSSISSEKTTERATTSPLPSSTTEKHTTLISSTVAADTTSNKFTTTGTTTTSYTCSSTPNEVEEFTCAEWGRFPDISDPLCQRYYLCSYLQNGSFVRTEYKCLKSVFDPVVKKCSKEYICPCSTSSSTSSVSLSVATTTASQPSATASKEPTTESVLITTRTSSTSSEETITASTTSKPSSATIPTSTAELASSTPISESVGSSTATTVSYLCPSSAEEVEEFSCTKWGRFPDLSDPRCRRYYLCSYLHNGTFVKTEYKCLKSVFDPVLKKCSKDYVCPCSISSSTSSVSTTSSDVVSSIGSTSTSSKESTTGSIVLTTTSSTSSTSEETTTASTTSKTSSVSGSSISVSESSVGSSTATTVSYLCPSSAEDVDEFSCTEWGRFPDLSDPLCQRYYLCSYLQNGSFVKTEYKCLKSVFDPVTKRCSKEYVCPCIISSSTSSISATTTSAEHTSTTSSEYTTEQIVFTSTTPSMSSSISNGPTTTSSTPEIVSESTPGSSTRVSESTHSTATTISYLCPSSSDEVVDFSCTEWGRFPDLSDPLCQRYYLCSYLQNGSFVKTEYKCLKSVFDPVAKKCSKEYVCPCTTIASSSITPSPQTSSPTTISYGTSKTTEKPTAPSTTQKLTTAEKTSPVANSTSSFITTTTSYTCESSSHEVEDYKCKVWGRFPDYRDPLCQRYFLCSILQNGSFVKTEYKCLNSVFDPVGKRCSKQYVCPCTLSSSSSSVGTTKSSTEPFTSTVSSSIPAEANATAEFSTISFNESSTGFGCAVVYREFICTQEGRFPDFSDMACRKYFLCSHLRNGTFIRTSYKCLNSLFNPLIYRCSLSYVCPCKDDQTVITTPISSEPIFSEGFTFRLL